MSELSTRVKEKVDSYKFLWRGLKNDQKISLSAMLFLLFTLPVAIILSISPIKSLPGFASFPVTPPTNTPTPATPPINSLTPTPADRVIFFDDMFEGSGEIDTAKWSTNWVDGTSTTQINGQLKVAVPSGSAGTIGNSFHASPILGFPSLISGDFDIQVDLNKVESTNGWQELVFSPNGMISVRRNKINNLETLEVWTSADNRLENAVKEASISLINVANLKVRMLRVGGRIYISYFKYTDNGFVNLIDITMPELSGIGNPPSIGVRNGSQDFPAITAFFDTYYGRFTLMPTPTPTPTLNLPTQTPTRAPTITRVPTITAFPTVVDPFTPTPTRVPTNTPTVAPPPGNLSPRITTNMFKSARIRRFMEREIQAVDRNGDSMTMVATNLPPGTSFGNCNFRLRDTGVSALNCKVTGFPSQTGIFATKFLAKDIWGAETVKTIYFTILP